MWQGRLPGEGARRRPASVRGALTTGADRLAVPVVVLAVVGAVVAASFGYLYLGIGLGVAVAVGVAAVSVIDFLQQRKQSRQGPNWWR